MNATELNELINEAIRPAGNVEQSMGEQAAERAEFYRDMEREQDCA
jgi:hypothetical protein